MNSGAAPVNPLQLTQWLYRAQDLGLVVASYGGFAACWRVTLSNSSPVSDDAVNFTYTSEPIDLPAVAAAELLPSSVSVVNNSLTGRQELTSLFFPLNVHDLPDYLWTAATLAITAGSGNPTVVNTTSLNVTVSPVQIVIDYLPTAESADAQAQTAPLLLAGCSGSQISLFTCDPATDSYSGPWTIDCGSIPSLQSGYLMRWQMDVWIVLLVSEPSGSDFILKTYAIPATDLAAAPGPVGTPIEAIIGTSTDDEFVSVSAAVVQSIPAAQGQQLAVSTLPSSWEVMASPALALVGFDANGNLTTVQSIDFVTSFVDVPVLANVQIAAADFQNAGTDQIVVGVTASLDDIQCAGLSLFSWDVASGTLKQQSNYACTVDNPLGLFSLVDISAGVFWAGGPANGTMGVAVVGMEANDDGLQLSVNIVPVTPSSPPAFPPFTNTPAVLTSGLVTDAPAGVYDIDMGWARGVDFSGLSVVLGPPAMDQIDEYQQILALICSPPFDGSNSSFPPSLTFGTAQTAAQAITVTSAKSWTHSKDTDTKLNVGVYDWSRTLSSTYGTDFSLTNENSTTNEVTVTTEIQATDLMVVYGLAYTVWTYPIYQVSTNGNTPAGSLVVVFPDQAQPSQQVVPAYDPNLTFGYQQPYENGILLSYVGLTPDGYDTTDPAEMLFETIGVAVTTETEGTTIVYDSTKMSSGTTNTSKNVTTNLSNSNALTLSTKLFSFLPVAFGLSIKNSSSFTGTTTNNTSLSYTQQLTITIRFGAVSDASLEYTVTPLIYQHPALGCMVVSYQVTDLGPGWSSEYSSAKPMLVRPFRSSSDLLLSAFSPSISFTSEVPGAQINVVIFNCGFTPAVNVICTAYAGLPDVSDGSLAPPAAETIIGSVTMPNIGQLMRTTVPIPWSGAAEAQPVTIAIQLGGELVDIGWIAYPQSASNTFIGAAGMATSSAVGTGE